MTLKQNIGKIIVNFFIGLFVILIILTFLLLVLYYITPNNYTIYQFDETKYFLIKEYLLEIKPESNLNVMTPYLNIFFKFDSESNDNDTNEINLLITNIIKSQSLIYNKNELICSNSKIIIQNNSKNEIKINLGVYQKNLIK